MLSEEVLLHHSQISECSITMRARSRAYGCTVRTSLPGSYVAVFLSGSMPRYFLLGRETEIANQAAVARLVARRRLTVETMMSERPIGRRFEITVIACVHSAGMLRQCTRGHGVLRSQVLIERYPVAKVDRIVLIAAQVALDVVQLAHHDGHRFVDNVDAAQVPLRFQVDSHRFAIHLANVAQAAKVTSVAPASRILEIAFRMSCTLPMSWKGIKKIVTKKKLK